MRVFRSLIPLFLAVAVLSAPAAAQAVEYPPEEADAGVSDATVVPGEDFVFSGSGFKPGERIDIDVDKVGSDSAAGVPGARSDGMTLVAAAVPLAVVVKSVTASSSGTFRTTVELNSTGVFRLTATGAESGNVATAVVRVVVPSGASAGDDDDSWLPVTGAAARTAAIGGGAAILFGVAMLWFAKGRRRRTESET